MDELVAFGDSESQNMESDEDWEDYDQSDGGWDSNDSGDNIGDETGDNIGDETDVVSLIFWINYHCCFSLWYFRYFFPSFFIKIVIIVTDKTTKVGIK